MTQAMSRMMEATIYQKKIRGVFHGQNKKKNELNQIKRSSRVWDERSKDTHTPNWTKKKNLKNISNSNLS